MLIIGICGGTCCGKTSLVKDLLKDFTENNVGVLYQDSYYKKNSHLTLDERKKINFDHPESIDFDLLVMHLKALKKNQPIEQPTYSFITHDRNKETIKTWPKKVLIVEGILILSHPELRDMLDIKFYIDTNEDERLIRRIKRDTIERGRDVNEVLNRYQNTIKPMHEEFIEPMKLHADMIIPNNKKNTVALTIIKTLINHNL